MRLPGILFEARELSCFFPVKSAFFSRRKRWLRAVDQISFTISMGRSLALVGESGCGKTTTGRIVSGLENPSEGMSFFMGEAIPPGFKGRQSLRRSIQMIFQDPYDSLNPRMTVEEIVGEPLQIHRLGTAGERRERVAESLALVGLQPPRPFFARYPHELSGGQRQRVSIARSFILKPKLVVADEPASMLDVSVRSGVMKLMLEYAEKERTQYLYITHDLAVARYMADRIAVMYLGKIVEIGDMEEILVNPLHPYTKALIQAVPVMKDAQSSKDEPLLKGWVSKPIDPPPYCRFYDRCPCKIEVCRDSDHPELIEVSSSHAVSCHVIDRSC